MGKQIDAAIELLKAAIRAEDYYCPEITQFMGLSIAQIHWLKENHFKTTGQRPEDIKP